MLGWSAATQRFLRLPRMSSALVGRLYPGWRSSVPSLDSALSRSE